MEPIFKTESPTATEYLTLRESVGWPLPAVDVAAEGLSRSLFCVCAFLNGELVGMGRIVGDNAIYFHIQDVIIRPEFQNKGIGRQIMQLLLQYIDRHASKNSCIGLMASKDREPFYEAFGFSCRPGPRHGAGMTKFIT